MEFDTEEIITFSDIKDFKKNPFVEELVINKTTTLKRFKKGEVIINEDESLSIKDREELTKENEELKSIGLEIGKIKIRQKANFVLLYIPIFKYKSLSEISFKIWFYIIESKLNLGQDKIILGIDECCEELNASRPTITKGLVELVKNKIISKQCDNVWWINPNYFYAGNRLKINTK